MTPRHVANNLMDGPRAVAAVTRIGMIAYLVITTIMWANNSWGKMELNFAFVFISFFGVLYTVVSPVVTVPWLGLYVLSPAAAEEVKQVLLKLLFSFMLTATFLATWSFGASPWSFWALFALLLGLLTWQLVHKDKFGEITKKIQLGYLLVFIALILLKTMGVDLGSKVSASTLENLGNEVSSVASSTLIGSDCSDNVPVVEHGARLTVRIDCPVTVDQRRMAKGMDFVLVDPVLRAQTGNQQLVSFDQKPGSHEVTLLANVEGFKRLGRSAIEIELYNKGTGAEAVAKRHGIYIAPDAIDLRPAP